MVPIYFHYFDISQRSIQSQVGGHLERVYFSLCLEPVTIAQPEGRSPSVLGYSLEAPSSSDRA